MLMGYRKNNINNSGAFWEKVFVFFILSIVTLFLNSAVAQDWKELHKQGKQAYAEGKYQEAYDHFMNAQRIAPDDISLAKDIGTTAYRKGDFKKAEEIFSNVTSTENKALAAKKWHNIGNSQMKQKSYAKAVESYKESLRLDPSNQDTRYNYAEAKRRLEQQQNEQNDQNQDESDNNDNQNDQNQSQNDHGDNNEQNENNQSQQDAPPSDGQNKDGKEQEQAQMSQKAADKMLEELLKKEMETKRKMQGYSKSEQTESKSGKKW
jgi:Ca-activated chloride channel family protein